MLRFGILFEVRNKKYYKNRSNIPFSCFTLILHVLKLQGGNHNRRDNSIQRLYCDIHTSDGKLHGSCHNDDNDIVSLIILSLVHVTNCLQLLKT